jgi:hypothetical protein
VQTAIKINTNYWLYEFISVKRHREGEDIIGTTAFFSGRLG